jgi:DNA-binding transcriptional LysR family regulator
MKQTDDLRFFALLVREGSLAAAARQLGVTPSAVTQRLQALEAALGVRLLDRSTRRIRLTDEGTLYHDIGAGLTRDYDELVDTLRSRQALVRGKLRVHGPLGFGRKYLASCVARFHVAHPQLEIALTLSDRRIDAATDAFDLIVHIGELRDSAQVAYPIAPNRRVLCAAPAYLKRAGRPATPEALAAHACLVLRENDEDVTMWRFASGRREAAVRVKPMLSSNDGEVIRQWALAGQGIMLRSEWDVAELLRSGRLEALLPAWKPPAADVVALVAERRGMSARVKAFLAFLAAEFRPKPPWRVP